MQCQDSSFCLITGDLSGMRLNCVWVSIIPDPPPCAPVLSFKNLRGFAKRHIQKSEAQGKLCFKYSDLTFVLSKRCVIDIWLRSPIIKKLQNIGKILHVIRQFIFAHTGYLLGSFRLKINRVQASGIHKLRDHELYKFIAKVSVIPGIKVIKPPATEHRLVYNLHYTDLGSILVESGRLSLTCPDLSKLVKLSLQWSTTCCSSAEK